MPTPKVVEITWRDCTYVDEVFDAEEAMVQSLIVMHDIGYLIGEDEEKICLGGEWIESQECYRHLTWIPKVNIIHRRFLK